MTPAGVFAASLGVVLALLAAAIGPLLPPLSAVLAELCGTRRRAGLWTTLSALALAIGALLAGLLGFLAHGMAGGASPAAAAGETVTFWGGVGMLQGSLAGLLFGLAVIAAVVLQFSARMAAGIRPPPPAGGTS
jgi:hypothetical protein